MEGITDAAAAETQPLLHTEIPNQDSPSSNFVDFDPNGDVENPLEWPATYKWAIVSLLAFTAFTVTFCCISVVPVANSIIADLDGSEGRKSSSVLLVTIWELGEAAGPLFIAPLSEVFGRYPIMVICNMGFVGATLLASFSPTVNIILLARFLTGLSVASNVLNPAIVGDMFASEQRGTAMSLIMLCPLIGGAFGPAITGFIAQSVGWRPVLWICAGLAGLCEIIFLACFRETFKVPILNRRAARLRKETGNEKLRTIFEVEDSQNGRKVWESMLRPFIVLIGSGVLQAMSIFGSLTFTYFYIMSTTFPDILQNIYGLNPAETGFAFIAFSVGSIISVIICNRLLDPIYIRLREIHKGIPGQPEYRLPLVILGAFTLPIVVTLYGWVSQLRLPLIILLIVNALLGSALLLGFLPLMAYVVDAFGLYSASAMTAVIVVRCLMGTFLPLATEPLVGTLGYGMAFTVLGVISLGLAPVPVCVMWFGGRWRQGSRYTRAD